MCTLLGAATLYNHSVPPVDVSIAEGLVPFLATLWPTFAFRHLSHIALATGSVGAGHSWPSDRCHCPGKHIDEPIDYTSP